MMVLLRYGAALVLVTASLGQLNRLFIGDASNIVLYANDLFVGILAAAYVAHVLTVRRSWRIPWPLVWVGLFTAIAGISLLLGSSALRQPELLVSAFYLLRYVSYLVLFFLPFDDVVYASSPRERLKSLKWWSWVLLLAVILVAASGFIQLFVLPDLAVLAKYGWDPHYNRLVTTFLDPNFAGCYLSIGVALSLGLALDPLTRLRSRLVLSVITLLLLLAIILTFSRSGYLMLAIVVSVIAVWRARWLLLVGGLIGLASFALVPRVQQRVEGAFNRDETASIRVISWQNSLRIASDYPLLGVGFNSYRYAQDRYGIVSLEQSGNAGAGADSSWLFVLATTGALGLVGYSAAYFSFAWTSLQSLVHSKEPFAQSFALMFLAVLVGLGVASQFNNGLFYIWILELLWPLGGLALGLSKSVRDEGVV